MPVESHLHSSTCAESISYNRTTALRAAAEHAEEFLCHVSARSVVPSHEALAALSELQGPVPIGQASAEEVLDLLARFGSPATIANSGGRYFGFVNGGCVPAALAAAWLVSAWDQNAAMRVQSPIAIALEETALDWVRQMLGLPPGCGGAVTTGATMANFCA